MSVNRFTFRVLACTLPALAFVLLIPAVAVADSQAGAGNADPLVLAQMQMRQRDSERLRFVPAGPRAFSGVTLPDNRYQCDDTCLCKGADDCVKLTLSGCCAGTITCNETGCSCVNGSGCSDSN